MIDRLIQIWKRELREARDDLAFNLELFYKEDDWGPIVTDEFKRDQRALCERVDRAIYTLDDLRCIREGRVPIEIWF